MIVEFVTTGTRHKSDPSNSVIRKRIRKDCRVSISGSATNIDRRHGSVTCSSMGPTCQSLPSFYLEELSELETLSSFFLLPSLFLLVLGKM
jgi:hypothetical protein